MSQMLLVFLTGFCGFLNYAMKGVVIVHDRLHDVLRVLAPNAHSNVR
jgi:hypothetical protein